MSYVIFQSMPLPFVFGRLEVISASQIPNENLRRQKSAATAVTLT